MSQLKIALLAPIKRPITPDTTVSRSRVITDLSRGLIKKNHQVTIFASQDSKLPGIRTIGVVPKGLNFMPESENPFYQHTGYLTIMMKKLIDLQGEFDIVHNHMYPEYLPLLITDLLKIPMLTTVHSQMTAETSQVLKYFPKSRLVAISMAAREASGITDMTVIHNGIDIDLYSPDDTITKEYLLTVGRMSKAKDKNGNFLDPKGIQNAITVAEKTGERLKIVGNVEDVRFYETLVKPHLSDKIEFVGEVSPEQKLSREQMVRLFQGAKALLNPINWEEPFGLVMAEALACGTPVIAYKRGSVEEIVVDKKVGYVVDPTAGIDGLVEAVQKILQIERSDCRSHAVESFSIKQMVEGYEKLYFDMLK